MSEDNLFILKTVIHELNVKQEKPLYTCLVDFSKFVDAIARDMFLRTSIVRTVTD